MKVFHPAVFLWLTWINNVAECCGIVSGYPSVGQRFPDRDPTLTAGLFEGDIIGYNPIMVLNGVMDEKYRWPNATVPYELTDEFSEEELEVVFKGMYMFHESTCVRFVQRTAEDDYVNIGKNQISETIDGCASNIGHLGGRQLMALPNQCLTTPGIPAHELMHAIGFYHEQSRTDRDKYITIIAENVQPGHTDNFLMEQSITFGTDYDYGSIMHYPAFAFGKRGSDGYTVLQTIVPKKDGVKIGQRDGLSETDIVKINRMYKCDTTSQHKIE